MYGFIVSLIETFYDLNKKFLEIKYKYLKETYVSKNNIFIFTKLYTSDWM